MRRNKEQGTMEQGIRGKKESGIGNQECRIRNKQHVIRHKGARNKD
jgi:hypothetical protein